MAEPAGVVREEMFPKLSDAQIARLATRGSRRTVVEGEVIFEPGVRRRSLFVVLKGRLEGTIPASGGENRMTILEAGDFTGEVDLLSGRPSLVRARALTESDLLEIDVATLRRIVQTDPELSEIFLRAFVRRRAMLIAQALGGLVLIGSRFSADSLRLKEFLARNGQPY